MKKINRYLDNIQETSDSVIFGSVIATGAILASLISLLIAGLSLKKHTKVDSKLSSDLNNILNSGDKWVVHVYASRTPNAFSLGYGRHIFISSVLKRILNKNQLIAVLLHESYHSSKKHVPQYLAVKYPLFFILSIIMTTMVTGGVPILAFLMVLLVSEATDLLWDITIARKQEINADSFAVKNGYGKQLVEALNIIEKWVKSHSRPCKGVCQIMSKIDSAISSHPSNAKRIEEILKTVNKMKNASFAKIKSVATKVWKQNG